MNLVEIIGRGGGPLSRYMVDKAIAYLWSDNPNMNIHTYMVDNNIEGDAQKIGRSRAFRAWFRDTFEERVWNAYYNIERRIQDNQLTVYREITAPKNWQPDRTQHPGRYWSWDKNSAEAHWGNFNNGDVKWLLIGAVAVNQIDWVETLAKNANFDYEEEREISLKPNGKINLIDYYER